MKQKTKILWVSRHRLSAARQSGTPYFMVNALEQRFASVERLDGLSPLCHWNERRIPSFRLVMACAQLVPGLVSEALRGKRYDWDRSPALARYYARCIQVAVRSFRPDVIIGDKAYVEFSYLDTSIPVLYLHDAMAEDLVEYGDYFRRFGPLSRQNALMLQARALMQSTTRIFSSGWAAQSCARHYPALTGSTHVLYNGPCLDDSDLPESCPMRSVEQDQPVRFLLVGVNWYRKGVDTAIKLVEDLRRMGARDVVLDVCGMAATPSGVSLPSFVHWHGTLDKSDPTQRERLLALYRGAHFFLLPSSEECLAQSCIEAMAFGLPCVVRDSGGQREVTDGGAAGWCYRDDRERDDAIASICECMRSDGLYRAKSLAAFACRRKHFDWSVWADGMVRALARLSGAGGTT